MYPKIPLKKINESLQFTGEHIHVLIISNGHSLIKEKLQARYIFIQTFTSAYSSAAATPHPYQFYSSQPRKQR